MLCEHLVELFSHMKFSQHYLMELRLRTPHFNPRLAVTQHCDVSIMLRYWCSFVLVLISNEGIMKPPALDVCLCRPLNKTHLHVDVRQFSSSMGQNDQQLQCLLSSTNAVLSGNKVSC